MTDNQASDIEVAEAIDVFAAARWLDELWNSREGGIGPGGGVAVHHLGKWPRSRRPS